MNKIKLFIGTAIASLTLVTASILTTNNSPNILLAGVQDQVYTCESIKFASDFNDNTYKATTKANTTVSFDANKILDLPVNSSIKDIVELSIDGYVKGVPNDGALRFNSGSTAGKLTVSFKDNYKVNRCTLYVIGWNGKDSSTVYVNGSKSRVLTQSSYSSGSGIDTYEAIEYNFITPTNEIIINTDKPTSKNPTRFYLANISFRMV